jgi:hypothetical protein
MKAGGQDRGLLPDLKRKERKILRQALALEPA